MMDQLSETQRDQRAKQHSLQSEALQQLKP